MTVTIKGWKKGILSISLVRLIQTELHLSLKEAKACVDSILQSQAVVFHFESREQAEVFLGEATALGVVGELSAPS